MRIRLHLVLMAAAILLPVILAAGLSLERIREGERQAALRGLRETVRATALIVDREIQGSLSALAALGNSARLESGDYEGLYREAAALNRLPDVWTLVLDADGRQLLNTIVPFGTPAPPPVARERVRQVLETGKPLITDLLVGPVTGKQLTVVYVPARARGGKSFVVAQSFLLDHWKKTALDAQRPQGWIMAVIDRRGRFIARSHKADELLGQMARPELVAAAAAQASGLIRHATLEGIDAYDAFDHSMLSGWTIAVAAPVTLIEAPALRALQFALAGMGLAVLVAVLAAAAFGRRFIGAIEAAGRAAVALGRGERPQPVTGVITEVNQLHAALADAGDLLAAERQSRQAVQAEREQLLERERAGREAAQAQNLAKDQFLAILGHELRNPLAAIAGATTLLDMTGGKDAGQGRYLDIIRRQNRHLAHIVDDLLDVSRLMAGKVELESRPLDLQACVRSCVEAVRTTERAAGHRIELHAGPAWVLGDAVRLEQVLNNLLANALKFSPPGSPVSVTLATHGADVLLTVSDQGSGISPGMLRVMFEPFVQGPPPANRAQGGLGVGLALVRQLVLLHGGTVEGASAGPGLGAVFSVRLPAIAQPKAPASEPVPAGGGRGKLLYVEDNDDARATTAQLLRSEGFEVVELAHGATALQTALAVRPDAIVLDIGLPDLDGYEVARRLRAHPDTQAIALVALTGYGQLRDKEDAARAGFHAHLVKPASAGDIARAIAHALAAGAGPEP